jgi:hypothetical protein
MMERAVYEVGIATIAAVIACATMPLLMFAQEFLMHGLGALLFAVSLFLFSAFVYLWSVVPILYLMLPLLAFARSRGVLACVAAVVAGPLVVFVIYASQIATVAASGPAFENAMTTASFVTLASIFYYVVARWMPQT